MTDTIGNSPHLALILQHDRGGDGSKGSAIIMDNSYQRQYTIPDPEKSDIPKVYADGFDFHEINPYTEDKALALLHLHDHMTFAGKDEEKSVTKPGFVEFNITTGEVLFEWNSGDRIALEESDVADADAGKLQPDFVHPNSIDKNDDGNYLFSGRMTDAVYLVSGEDGKIIWRLGGKKSDFEMDFEFSRQHHAKFVSVNATNMVLSLFNNGADESTQKEPTSSAMYVGLDLRDMKARLLNRYSRPDGKSTKRRGNMQTLPNDNVFVCWSWKGYISEFSHDGKLLMDASFASERFSTYRAYKSPWSSQPAEPPTLVSSWYGVDGLEKSTVFHVSWNGATDVKSWRFNAQANESSERVELETVAKSGFETSYIAPGYMDWVSVDALNAKHEVLGKSAVIRSASPQYWPEGAKKPQPDNPALFKMATVQRTSDVITMPNAALSAVLFIAGALTTAVGFTAVFFYPVFRDYACGRYSKLHSEDSEDSEEGMPLNMHEA